MTRDTKRRSADLFAVDSHQETRPAHRIAGGVMFDTPSDQPSTARSTRAGKAKAESRAPTAKHTAISKRRKDSPLSRALLEHVTARGNVTRD